MVNALKRKIDKALGFLAENDDSNRKTLFSMFENFNWLAIENIFRTAVSLLVFALMARYLGPEKFGFYNYAFAIVGLFSVLSTLGLEPIIVKHIVNDKTKASKILGTSLGLRLIGSVLMIALSLVYLFMIDDFELKLQLFVFLFGLSYLLKSFEVVDYWFQAGIKSKLSVSARSIGFLVGAVTKVLLIYFKFDLVYFVYVVLFEQLISSALMYIFYFRKADTKIRWSFDFALAKEVINESWPLILGGIATMVYMKVDQLMIGKMLGSTDLGHYYSAVKLSESWYFIPNAIAISVFPAILKAKKISEELFRRRLQILFDLVVWMGILLSLGMTILAPLIVYILGSEYAATVPVLQVHIWTNVFMFIGAIAARWVIAEGFTKNALLRTIIGAILNVILNFILIPRLGIMGAAISTIISYGFVNFVSLALFSKTRYCFFLAAKAFFPIRLFGYLRKWLS